MNVLTTVWHESGILFLIRGLAIGVIFCVLRELSFGKVRLGKIGFSYWKLVFLRKKESPGQIIDNIFVQFYWLRAMEIHILKQHYVLRTLCKTNKIDYFSLSFDYKNE